MRTIPCSRITNSHNTHALIVWRILRTPIFFFTLLVPLLFVIFTVQSQTEPVKKLETLHVFPGGVASSDWTNRSSIFSQDVPEDGLFQDFSESNSAYIGEDPEPLEIPSSQEDTEVPDLPSPPTSTATSSSEEQPQETESTLQEAGTTTPTENEEASHDSELQNDTETDATLDAVPAAEEEPTVSEEETVSEPEEPTTNTTGFRRVGAQLLTFFDIVTEIFPLAAESTTTSEVEPTKEIEAPEEEAIPRTENSEKDEEAALTEQLDGNATSSDEQTDGEETHSTSTKTQVSTTTEFQESNIEPTGEETQEHSIAFSNFAVPELSSGQFITNVQLRMSFGAKLKEPAATSSAPAFEIEYRLGGEWESAGVILLEDEVSNALNGGYHLFALPTLSDITELQNLEVRVSYDGDPEILEGAYVDAVWLEVDTEIFDRKALKDRVNSGVEKKLKQPKVHELVDRQLDFRRTEHPIFTLRYISQRNAAVRFVRNLLGRDLVALETVSFLHVGHGKVDINPEINVTEDGLLTIQTTEADRTKMYPGVYTVELTVREGNKVFTDSFDFQWGLLAVNPDQTEYQLGDVVSISLGALTPNGNTLCNADLRLYIIDNTDYMYRVPVLKSGECFGNNVTDVPDYSAVYVPKSLGTHELYVERLDDKDGTVLSYTSDMFEVVQNHHVALRRNGPTRIYPPAPYPMQITIQTNRAFNGTLTEVVPGDFVINDTDATIERRNGTQILSWDVDMMADTSKTVSYTFDAPDLSPYLYELGPAELQVARGFIDPERATSTGTTTQTRNANALFVEHREWQIASDATGNMILFWDDGASIPTDWSCLSCGSGTFYQRFVVGSSTYNTTGGSLTHTHSADGSVNAAAGSAFDNNSGTNAQSGHTHTYAPTISDENNLPEYRQLRVIQYTASAGEPATIPAGAIGIFDVASSSLPSGWTRYEAQDGYYIYGEDTPGTVSGSSTHTHTVSGTTGQASGSGIRARGNNNNTAPLTHTHTVSGSSGLENNEPPYIEVLLAELGSDAAPPNNLITMWTEDVPSGWIDVSSDPTDPFNGRFIKPAATYGATGGSNTHNHTDVTGLTSSAPSAIGSANGGSTPLAGNAHTHQVSVTNFSSENHLPPYLTAVFGKRQGTNPVYDQHSFRWYTNGTSSSTPTDPWPEGGSDLGEREPITATSTTVIDGEIIRLRMNMSVTNATATAGSRFKLQYGVGLDCAAIGSWADVGSATSSAVWRGYDNSGVTDHSTLASTTLASTTVAATYEENGYATGTPNDIAPSAVGEWDFVLEHNNAASGTTYCFRMVEEDGTPFSTYSAYPQLLTNRAPNAPTLSKLFDNEKTPTTTPIFQFVATDPEGDELNYQIQVDNSYDFGSPIIDEDTTTNNTQFENQVITSDKDPFTHGQLMQFTTLPADGLTNGTTYYWRVRARDPDENSNGVPQGSNDWGLWSDIRSFTVDTSLLASAWYQTEDEQFDTNMLVNVSTGSDRATPSSAGSMTSPSIDFDDGEAGTAWGQFSFTESDTNNEINYQIEYLDETSTWTLIPDSDLPGNSTGLTASTNLLNLNTETYNEIRLVANFTGITGSPYVDDWTVEWGYRIAEPTITMLFSNEKVGTTTPTFEFTTTDPQDDDLTYEIQWSTEYDFSASTTRISSSSAGFVNFDDGGNSDPFRSGDTIRFTIQAGDTLLNDTTYWWRVRATDPNGADAFSFWTEPRSFTVATDTVVSTWFQTTEEQFDTDILAGTISVPSDAVSVATTATEALMVYGEGTETEPRYRQWNGSSWGSEGTMGDIGAPLKWAVVKAGTIREEYVAATAGTDGDIHVQVFDTGAWGNQTELTTTMGDINSRGFDVEYQTLSGDAFVVYCDGDADPSYDIWDGANWTNEGTIDVAETTNCEWIELAADPVSDELIVMVRGADGNPFEAQVWDPDISDWATSTTLGSVTEANNEGMTLEYEESGDQAVIVTSDGNPNRLAYNTWNGSSWGGAGTQALGGDLEWGQLVRDSGSDEMALCLVDDASDIAVVRWSGSGWTLDDNLETSGDKSEARFSCVYETTGARDGYIMLGYSDTTATRYTYFNTTDWSIGENTLDATQVSATMSLERTGDGTILGILFDSTDDELLSAVWNGSNWATSSIESDASVDASPYGRPYSIAPRNSGTDGTVIVSPGIRFTDGVGPYWEEMSWVDSTPGSSEILYSVQYYNTASSAWQFIPNSEIPGNESGTTTGPIDLSGLNTSTYGLIRPYAALSCDGASNCPLLFDWTVEWAGGITVSGTLQRFDQSTNVNSGTVAVAVNGVLQTAKLGSVSGGMWSIDNVTAFPGDIVTVFVNGTTSEAEAVGVTRYDGNGDITGLSMYEQHLSLGSDDATTTPLTNADIGQYDVDNDEDVFIDLEGTTLTLCGESGCGGAKLLVGENVIYKPAGTLDTHDIEINGTFLANGNTIYVGGSWDNNATATMATSTVIFSATSTSETVDSTGALFSSFNNVTFGSSTSSGDWALVTPLDVNGNLAVNEGTLLRGTTSITVAGNLSTGANGSWSGIGTTTFDGSVARTWSDAHATSENVGNVVINGSSKSVTLAGNVGAESITIGADDVLDASASHYDITVYQNWRNNNAFVPRQGEVFFAATSTNKEITTGGNAFYDLSFIGAGGSWSFTEANLSINNDLTVATGTLTLPTGTTTLGGSFDSAGGTFMHNNAAVLLTSSNAETIIASGTPFTNNFYTLNFNGSGSWTFLDATATTSDDLIIQQGTVTLPGGVLSIGGSFANTGGTFLHNSGSIQFTSTLTETIETNAAFSTLRFTGSGNWSFVDAEVTLLGDLSVSGGNVTLPSGTLTLGGSLTNTATLSHNSGTVSFTSTDTGEIIDLGGSSLSSMVFNSQTGGWSIVNHATATNDVTIGTSSSFTLAPGNTLSVGGTFTNSVGGASTTWLGSILSLEAGAYAINTKIDAGDTYDTLRIKANTDVAMWNSGATTTEVAGTGSLYSQDHDGVDGALYVFGEYTRTSGTEHWSYAVDFDGTDLSGGSERVASVSFADGGSAAIQNATLSIVGSSTASTTIQNQGSGTYTVSVTNGTTTAEHYDFDDLGTTGLSLLGGTVVTSLKDGAFTPSVAAGTGLTVSSSTIDANPGLQIYRVNFSTTTPIAATNVTQDDGTPSSYWWFRNSTGNIDGEQFDADPDGGGNPGTIRWDDSALVVTLSGVVYEDDESTPLGGPTCGTGTPVRVVVKGGSTYDGACNVGNGSFSIPGVTIVGDPTITVFLNGAAGGERAALVTKTVTDDVDTLDLYAGRVITRHEDVEAMTIADMAAYDATDDPDIPFTAATGTEHTLTLPYNTELHVWATTTFTPGGSITLNGNAAGNSYDGTLHIGEGAVFTGAGTTTHTIGGSLIVENSGTFIPASTSIIMTATTTGKTITSETDETITLHELSFTGVGGGWNVNGNVSATGDLYVATGTVTGTGDITLTNGSFYGDGLVSLGGGTTTIETTNTLGGTQGWTFYDLTLGNGSVVGTTTPGGTATTSIDGRLTIETAHFLDTGSSVWDLGGTGTVFVENGTFLEDTSTVRYSGTGATNILSTDYHNLVLDALSGSPTYTATGLGIQVFNDLVIGANATTTVTFDTNDTALNVDGDMTIGTWGTFIGSGTGTFTLAGSYDNDGVFSGSGGTLTLDGSSVHTIAAGGSSFSSIVVDGTGTFTVTEHATATDALTLSDGFMTVQSGISLAVGGTFTNGTGGALTTWTGSTLHLYGGGNYEINASTTDDSYETLVIGADTDIRMWNSDAVSIVVDETGSLYSQDNADIDGFLYIYGDYTRSSGIDHWSWATDFDGTDLSGGDERAVSVYVANGATTTFLGGALSVVGDSTASTTVRNQGSGTYAIRIGGSASTTWKNYTVRDTNSDGLTFSGTPDVNDLSYGTFVVGSNNDSGMTVGGSVIDANPASIFTGNIFATSSGVTAATNITATGTSASAWRFTGHSGDIDGESFDNDPGGNPGYLAWDDSDLAVSISGRVYSDEGTTVSNVCDGTTANIRLVGTGFTATTTTCDGDGGGGGTGLYTFNNISYATGTTLTVYIDNETENGAAVTVDPISGIGNFDIYENRVIVRHEATNPITIDDMVGFDSSDDPGDVTFTAVSGSPDTLTLPADTKLIVWANKEFEPNGNVTLSGGGAGAAYDGTLELFSGATFDAASGESHSIGGSFISGAGATFSADTSSVTFTTTGAGRTIDTNDEAFYDIVFNGSGSWNITNNTLDVGNDLTLTSGSVTLPSGTTTVTGSFLNNGGSFDQNGGQMVFDSAAAENVKPGESVFGTTTFDGSGSWTYIGDEATSTGSFSIISGSVTAPTGTLAVGGNFVNNGTYAHANGALRLTSSAASTTVTLNDSDLYALVIDGTSTYTMTDTNAALVDTLTINSGTLVLATGTVSIGGSFLNTGGAFLHASGTILFNSSDTGEFITPGESSFHVVSIAAPTGGYTITGDATTTGSFSLTSAADFTLSSGSTLAVEGVFTNSVGGAATTWNGSTLKIGTGAAYPINTKSTGEDEYDTLWVGTQTDLRMWNSRATTTITDPASSLYSQDNGGVDGNLYIYGDYQRESGTDHWSYATDFDGVALSGGSERGVTVYMADNATTTFFGGTLQIIGVSGTSTLIQSQGSGTYAMDILGGTVYASYYAFRDLDVDGLNLQGTTTITSLSNGDFELAIDGGSLITVSSTTLNQNASKIITNVRFATTTAISGTNVTLVGSTPASWTFTGHSGNLDGEAFDSDGATDCGSVRWDDSSCLLTEQAAYRWRSNDGGEGVPNSEWFDLDWSKRKRVTLTNSDGETYTNAVIELQVAYDSDMQSDFDDLRFTDGSGTTTLDYFIATTTPGSAAEVWVEVPTLPASSDTTLYMYYGNGAAGDESNGTSTFIAFDDFEDGNISEYSGDTGEFAVVSGDAFERTYRLEASDPDNGQTLTGGMYNNANTVSQGETIRYMQYIDTGSGSGDETCTTFGTQNQTQNYAVCLELFGTDRIVLARNVLYNDTSGTILASSTVNFTTGWYEVEIDWDTDNSMYVSLYQNDTLIATTSASDGTYTSGGIGYALWYYHGAWDFYTSRPLLTTEPSVTIGSEQVPGGASWLSELNTKATGVTIGTTVRPRFVVENTGLLVTDQYQLEYALKDTAPSCESVSAASYQPVPVQGSCSGSPLCMQSSTQFTNRASTTDVLGGSGSFASGQIIEDPSNITQNVTVDQGEFTELEYAIVATEDATEPNYCVRVTDNGTDLDSYIRVAELQLLFAPNITIASLNNGLDIDLTPGATTTVYATGTVSDQNGFADLDVATATVFRSGVGENCSADNNNCYIASESAGQCSFINCAGNSCEVSCFVDIYYHADPTDGGTYAGETWRALLSVSDEEGSIATATAPSVDLMTLRYISLDNAIDYGTLEVQSNTGGYNATTTVENIGNDSIDVSIEGTDLSDGASSIIPASEQIFATSSFNYSACTVCTTLATTSTNFELDLIKPTSTTPAVTDQIFWGINIPYGVAGTPHQGNNTFYVIGD